MEIEIRGVFVRGWVERRSQDSGIIWGGLKASDIFIHTHTHTESKMTPIFKEKQAGRKQQ